MANKSPDFHVYVSRKGTDDKNYYNLVGSAWRVKNDGISIKLVALPVDGSLILFKPKDDD